MKKIFFAARSFGIATIAALLFASLVPQSLFAKGVKIPHDDGIEVFHEKDFPEEVEHENYSHPYRWNKLEGDKVQFKEIWGYLVTNRLKDFDKNAPLTDLALFGVDINCYGKLETAPKRNLAAGFNGRVHLVAVCNSMSTTHFVLDPKYNLRDELIKDLVFASISFDGLQIDYELVPQKDGENFLQFLKLLKKKLNGKELTVCVPARVKTLSTDVYDYKKIAAVADKIMIMAYDEHWATSRPGSIASVNWCKKIVDYALSVLSADKYIIGVSFYGRSWTDRSLAQAWYFNGANRIMHENEVKQLKRKDGVPHFEYEAKANVTVWFDDATSLLQRARMYKERGFDKIAFWRLGMEDAVFWDWITAE
ncbi:MAG: glycoside hydrolase [Treponema sp.]|nr:glycoside hydrolase [Treponema sp.]